MYVLNAVKILTPTLIKLSVLITKVHLILNLLYIHHQLKFVD